MSSECTITALNKSLPEFWSHANPVDVLGDAPSKRISKAVSIVLDDKNVDAVLVILTPQAMTNPTNVAKRIAELNVSNKKPILAAWLGGISMIEGISILIKSGIPTYKTPEEAIKAFMTMVEYSRNIERLHETPKDIRLDMPGDRMKLLDQIKPDTATVLSEVKSKEFLSSYGINTNRAFPARSFDEVKKIVKSLNYPVVLKIFSEDITHKTEAGGVILNIENDKALECSYKKVISNALNYKTDAKIEGVTVQSMVKLKNSVELIMGIKKDPVFGTIILLGAGGITAELYNDIIVGLPPLNEKLAMQMIKKLKIYPLLAGFRNIPPLNIDKLVEMLIRLSYLAAECPEIKELDINPILVSKEEVIAVDARVIMDKDFILNTRDKHSHLALKPYPEEVVRKICLNGTDIILRPIKPEDEPMWFEMLGSCSKETIYSRFRYFFHWDNHQAAVKYCFIDYDREIAIVAETLENNIRKLIGVGRLIADPDHDSVEYAVLINDNWQSKGLGTKLTDYCLEIAKKWGLKSIVAQTTPDNQKMINVFKKYNFLIEHDTTNLLVEVHKDLR